MSAPTLASSPLVKNAFAVSIAGFPAGYFTSAKIPQAKVKKTEVHPAGSPVAIKVPSGLAEIEDMEIKGFQGTDGALDRSIAEWSQQCAGVNRLGRATAKPLDAKRVVTVEYTLIKGVNDSVELARELAELLRDFPCKINLIPFNPFSQSAYERPSRNAVSRFWNVLNDAGHRVTVRTTRGDDIDAACGQLVGRVQDRTRRSARHRGAVPASSYEVHA